MSDTGRFDQEFKPVNDASPDGQFTNYCGIHNKVEVVTGDSYYRICFECGHIYQTEQELKQVADNFFLAMERNFYIDRKTSEKWLATKAEDIPSCPHCLHDW